MSEITRKEAAVIAAFNAFLTEGLRQEGTSIRGRRALSDERRWLVQDAIDQAMEAGDLFDDRYERVNPRADFDTR